MDIAPANIHLATLLPGCDIARGVRRPVAVGVPPDRQAVSQALGTLQGADIQETTADGVTQFSIRREAGFGVVRLAPSAKPGERFILYAIDLNRVPPPGVLAANRAVLDDAYAAIYRAIPSLPSPHEIKEERINLPKR